MVVSDDIKSLYLRDEASNAFFEVEYVFLHVPIQSFEFVCAESSQFFVDFVFVKSNDVLVFDVEDCSTVGFAKTLKLFK